MLLRSLHRANPCARTHKWLRCSPPTLRRLVVDLVSRSLRLSLLLQDSRVRDANQEGARETERQSGSVKEVKKGSGEIDIAEIKRGRRADEGKTIPRPLNVSFEE